MGQQQILLLVIGVILVGLATVMGMYIMQHYYQKDEADGLLDRSLAIATHAVYWKSKNDPFSGGSHSYARLAEAGLDMLALEDETIRGRFAIVYATVNDLQVAAVSDRFEGVGVCVVVNRYNIERSILKFDGSISLDEPCQSVEL
jgi:hypothetical protein